MSRNTTALVSNPSWRSFSVTRHPMSLLTTTTSRIRNVFAALGRDRDVPLQRVGAVELRLAGRAGREPRVLVARADELRPLLERDPGLEVHGLDHDGRRARRRRELVERHVGAELRRPRLPALGDQQAVAEVLRLEVRLPARVGSQREERRATAVRPTRNTPSTISGRHFDGCGGLRISIGGRSPCSRRGRSATASGASEEPHFWQIARPSSLTSRQVGQTTTLRPPRRASRRRGRTAGGRPGPRARRPRPGSRRRCGSTRSRSCRC